MRRPCPTTKFLEIEQRFHDNYAKTLDWDQAVPDRYSYESMGEDDAEAYFARLLGDVTSKIILDVGSGHGNCALTMARQGGVVTSIDISPKLIDGCRHRAEVNGVNVDFRVMNACELAFPDESFDWVVGFRTVHHLPDVRTFFNEAFRVLKRGGSLLIVEPQKYNPFVEIGRRFIRNAEVDRTETEHPLVPSDIRLLKNVFGNLHAREFEFLAAGCHALDLVGLPRARRLASKMLRPVDAALRRVPPLRAMYWQVVLLATK